MKKVNIDNNQPQPNFDSSNPMGMFGGMMGAMNGMMPPIPPAPSTDGEVIDAEFKEVEKHEENPVPEIPTTDDAITEVPAVANEEAKEEEPEEEFILIKTATPYNATIAESNGKKVATVAYLCRDTNDKLFVLNRNFILDNEEDEDAINLLPFAADDEFDFASRKIVTHSLNAYLDAYISDFKFTVDTGYEKDPNPLVWLMGTNLKTRTEMKIKMPADIFACIGFIDSYIFEGIINDHDLTLATVAGSKVLDTPAEFFLVDKIDSIVAMAGAEVEAPQEKGIKGLFSKHKKIQHSTTIGVVLKLLKYISNDEKEIAFALVPFDMGVEYEASKFRGKTIDDIQSTYYGDADQYVSTLLINSIRLYGVDKEYMVIRGKTKDMKVRLFLLDASLQEELKHLIEVY